MTVNDNLIRHYVFGVDLNYFLTDALWVGVQGQYYVKQTLPEYQLLGLQYNRLSYREQVPLRRLAELRLRPRLREVRLVQQAHRPVGDLGVGRVRRDDDRGAWPRNPANDSKAFKNTALTPNVGHRQPLLHRRLADGELRAPRLHHPGQVRAQSRTCRTTNAADAKANADSKLVNNLIFYVGVGIYFPMKFTYKTPG